MPQETFKLILDKSEFSAALKDSEAQAAQSTGAITASLEEMGEGGKKGAGGIHLVNDAVRMNRAEVREANGTIALLGDTIGLRIPRHCRTLISELAFVGPALNAAFSAVAIITIAKALYEAGEKAAEFFKKVDEAHEKNERASNELSMQLQKTNLELAIGNDKIEKQIGLLEKKPVNGLKLALDEAKLSAMSLASELDMNLQKERELLQASNPGWFQQFMGLQGTDSAVTGLGGYQNRVKGANADYDAKSRASTSVAGAEQVEIDRKAKLASLTVDYYNQLSKEIEGREELAKLNSKFGSEQSDGGAHRGQLLTKYGGGDQSAIIEALRQEQANIGVIGTQMDLEAHRAGLEQTQEADEAAKARAEIAKRGAEAAAKAQMQGFEQGLADMKNAHEVSVADEYLYWAKILESDKVSGANRLAIARTMGAEYQQILKENAGVDKESDKLRQIPSGVDLSVSAMPGLKRVGEDTAKWVAAINAGIQAQYSQEAEIAKSTIALAYQNGSISKLQEAQQVQTLHTNEYNETLRRLNLQLASQIQGTAEYQTTKNQIAGLNGQRTIQSQSDAQAVSGQTIGGAFSQSIQQTAQQFTNTPEQIRQANTQFLSGMNSNITALLTGQKTNWSQFLRQLANTFASDALKQGEGALMSFLPHFADGGYSGSDPIMVGEQGPEIFNPGSGGYVTANHKIGGGGTGGGISIGHIDARGTDPVLTQAAVERAMKQTHAQAVHDAGKAMQERSRRTPK